MDRILFGDNQFFGVNHSSDQKAEAQLLRFHDFDEIMKVLNVAYELGIRTLMCTTHDRVGEICDAISAEKGRFADFRFCPCLPYGHKYANAIAQLGVIGTLRKFGRGNVVSTVIRGTRSAITRDAFEMMKMLVDFELKCFEAVRMEVVFLQNVVTDLMLGLGMTEMLLAFKEYIESRYKIEAGFITMNLPLLLESLQKCGIENPIVCSSINKLGFRMCGGKEEYERVIQEKQFRGIAMSVLASGAIAPRDAIEYVCGQTGIHSIVFGASNPQHIRETRDLIEELSS